MNELEQFVKISKYAGQRFDLVQASGGNSSVKLDNDLMLIKASGYLLSEIEADKGYVKVNNRKILKILESETTTFGKNKREMEQQLSKKIAQAVIPPAARSSIETSLHALLDKYVLHTHPIVVNAVTCQKDWRKILENLFEKVMLINYKTPGIELAMELKQARDDFLKQHNCKPNIIFLQNHGIIVSCSTFEQIEILTEDVVGKLEKFLNVDLQRYKMTTKVSTLLNSIEERQVIAYLSDDRKINDALKFNEKVFFSYPFCPDKMVFCGISAVKISSLDEVGPLKDYKSKYYELPKVIIFEDHVFFIAQNVKKAKEIEDMFKFHVITVDMARDNVIDLPLDELIYLGNWEAERYRQNI